MRVALDARSMAAGMFWSMIQMYDLSSYAHSLAVEGAGCVGFLRRCDAI